MDRCLTCPLSYKYNQKMLVRQGDKIVKYGSKPDIPPSPWKEMTGLVAGGMLFALFRRVGNIIKGNAVGCEKSQA